MKQVIRYRSATVAGLHGIPNAPANFCMDGFVKERRAGKGRPLDAQAKKHLAAPSSQGDKCQRMEKYISFLGGVALLFLSGCTTPLSDDKAILGTWRGVSFEVDGRTIVMKGKGEHFEVMVLEFSRDGKGCVYLDTNKTLEGGYRKAFTYTLDAGKNPKWITAMFADKENPERMLYALEGDTLHIACTDEDRKTRPNSFSGEGIGVMFLQRRAP